MQRDVGKAGFRLRIGATDVGMIAGKPMLRQPNMAGKVRRAFVSAAPADTIEILPGFVDRVC
jgi:hypothetical protein